MLAADLRALGPIDAEAAWETPAGSITVLFGPSGAGKTTILRMVGGFHPAEGALTWRPADTDRPTDLLTRPPWRRPVGYVAQGGSLFSHWSVGRQIAEAAGVRGPGDPRVVERLVLVGLDGMADRRPRQLSGGQQQRAALARALARRPAVLLLDEPFAHLDAVGRRELDERLLEVTRSERLHVIMATHDWEEVERVADDVLLIDVGRVAVSGPPRHVFQNPPTARAAALLGYTLRRGWALHPRRAEWREPDACPLHIEAPVATARAGGLGSLVVLRGGDSVWEAWWPGEGAPAVGQLVRVGWWAPRIPM